MCVFTIKLSNLFGGNNETIDIYNTSIKKERAGVDIF